MKLPRVLTDLLSFLVAEYRHHSELLSSQLQCCEKYGAGPNVVMVDGALVLAIDSQSVPKSGDPGFVELLEALLRVEFDFTPFVACLPSLIADASDIQIVETNLVMRW